MTVSPYGMATSPAEIRPTWISVPRGRSSPRAVRHGPVVARALDDDVDRALGDLVVETCA